MVGLEPVGGRELYHIFPIFHHGPSKDVGEGVIRDAEFLLDKGDDRGSGELRSALMRIPCVILIFALEEAAAPRSIVLNLEVKDTPTTPTHGDFLLSRHRHILALGIIPPNILFCRLGRSHIHGRVNFACIIKV